MSYLESAVRIACEEDTLVGILAQPATPSSDTGIVIIVGGPQTRAGSHRQFVLLARALANSGFPVLRFDVRGMGDSTGNQRDFEHISTDIRVAIDLLAAMGTGARRFVLWGLCDAAAAALLYADETRDPRLAGLCLLNPWVRSDASLARTQVKHYYGQRLLQGEFWIKLIRGQLSIVRSVMEFARKLTQAARRSAPSAQPGFQDRMARGLASFSGRVQLILSGDDYTAKEFLEYAANSQSWRNLLDGPNLTRIDISGADHTFSSAEWREAVASACIDWLKHDEK